MRLEKSEEQEEDARIVLAEDGETVVIVKAGLLPPRAERVMGQVLGLLHDRPQVVAYPSDVTVRDEIDEPM